MFQVRGKAVVNGKTVHIWLYVFLSRRGFWKTEQYAWETKKEDGTGFKDRTSAFDWLNRAKEQDGDKVKDLTVLKA